MLFSQKENSADAKWRLIGWAGKTFIDLLFLGSRIDVHGHESIASLLASRRFIFAFWHSRILLLSYYYKRLNASIMVSRSADGEIIAQILQRQGHIIMRGSTRKGGLRALSRQIQHIRNHQRPGVVVPDGPQGPRHKVQPGVILLAQKTGFPIIPITYSAKRRKMFNSWDKFLLPYPATRCMVMHGRPIHVPPDADPQTMQQKAEELENELNRITAESDRCFGYRFEP